MKKQAEDANFREMTYGRCGLHEGVWRSLPLHVELAGDLAERLPQSDPEDEPGCIFDRRPR